MIVDEWFMMWKEVAFLPTSYVGPGGEKVVEEKSISFHYLIR